MTWQYIFPFQVACMLCVSASIHFYIPMQFIVCMCSMFSIFPWNMQELRDIAMTEAAKGKHFFLETDIKGPALKLDNTGKAILTVSSVFLF